MDSFPECTVDGEWVFYADASEEKDTSLMRQSLRGGAPQKLAQGRIWFDVSSVGKMLATAAIDKGAPLQIVSLDSLRTIRSFATRDFDDFVRFAFSADDRSIFYVTRKGADATIWRQPLDTATPVKVAGLAGRTVNWIRPSPDGKKLGLILERPPQRPSFSTISGDCFHAIVSHCSPLLVLDPITGVSLYNTPVIWFDRG